MIRKGDTVTLDKLDKHGTIQRYEQGCRCLFCCNSWLLYQREAYSTNLKTIPKPKNKPTKKNRR